MKKVKFEIWDNEKDTIIVIATLLLKYTAIEVVDKKDINESHFPSLPKKFQFEIIDAEKNYTRANWKYLNLDTKSGGESND